MIATSSRTEVFPVPMGIRQTSARQWRLTVMVLITENSSRSKMSRHGVSLWSRTRLRTHAYRFWLATTKGTGEKKWPKHSWYQVRTMTWDNTAAQQEERREENKTHHWVRFINTRSAGLNFVCLFFSCWKSALTLGAQIEHFCTHIGDAGTFFMCSLWECFILCLLHQGAWMSSCLWLAAQSAPMLFFADKVLFPRLCAKVLFCRRCSTGPNAENGRHDVDIFYKNFSQVVAVISLLPESPISTWHLDTQTTNLICMSEKWNLARREPRIFGSNLPPDPHIELYASNLCLDGYNAM